MPFQVWLLTLSAFAIGMAEFVIAGILPQVADKISQSNEWRACYFSHYGTDSDGFR